MFKPVAMGVAAVLAAFAGMQSAAVGQSLPAVPDVGPGVCVANCGGSSSSSGSGSFSSGSGGSAIFRVPSGSGSGLGKDFDANGGLKALSDRSSEGGDGEQEKKLKEFFASSSETSGAAPALALSVSSDGAPLIEGDTPALLRDGMPRGIALTEGATPEPPQGVSLANFDPATEARIGEGIITDRQLDIWQGRGHQYRTSRYERAAQLFFDAQTLTILSPLLVAGGYYVFYGAPTVVLPTLMQSMTLAALKFGTVVIQGQAAADAARAKTGSEADAQLAGAGKVALEGGVELVDNPALSTAKTMIQLAIRETGRPEVQPNPLGRVFGPK